jgi:hypothetical protein
MSKRPSPCITLFKAWLRAEKAAHRTLLRGQKAAHRKWERASEKLYVKAAKNGCRWTKGE